MENAHSMKGIPYCRFVKDVLHKRERGKDLFGRAPGEWSHRKIVVGAFSDSKLSLEIRKAVKAMRGIEFLVVFTVAAFYFSVMTRSVRTDQLVPDAEFIQSGFKDRRRGVSFGQKFFRELWSIVRLDALNEEGEFFCNMADKQS